MNDMRKLMEAVGPLFEEPDYHIFVLHVNPLGGYDEPQIELIGGFDSPHYSTEYDVLGSGAAGVIDAIKKHNINVADIEVNPEDVTPELQDEWQSLLQSIGHAQETVTENDLTDPGRVLGLECHKSARKLVAERNRLIKIYKEFKLDTDSDFYWAIQNLNEAANRLDDMGLELRSDPSGYRPSKEPADISGWFAEPYDYGDE